MQDGGRGGVGEEEQFRRKSESGSSSFRVTGRKEEGEGGERKRKRKAISERRGTHSDVRISQATDSLSASLVFFLFFSFLFPRLLIDRDGDG